MPTYSITGLKAHGRTNFRLSGNVLTLLSRVPGEFPQLTSKEKSEARAKLHFNDKINSLAVYVGKQRVLLEKEGWSLKFLTLTISRHMNREEFSYVWKKFRQRLKRRFARYSRYHKRVAYVATVERQKKSRRLHLHICIYSPYIVWDKLLKVWGEGGAYIEKVREYEGNGLNNLAGYMAKYMGKDFDNPLQ